MDYLSFKENFLILEKECGRCNHGLEKLSLQYKRALRIKEDLLMINFCEVSYDQLEEIDVIKTRILELIILLKIAILNNRALNISDEEQNLCRLYYKLGVK